VKKECKRGTPCSLTCIASDKICRENFPENMQGFIQKLASNLAAQYGDDEEISKERAKMFKVLESPSENFQKLLEGKSEEEIIWFLEMRVLTSGGKRDSADKWKFSPNEALGLRERAPELISAWEKTKEKGFNAEGYRAPGGVGDYIKKYRNKPVSDADVDLFWGSLSERERKTLMRSGSYPKTYWDGVDLDEEKLPTGTRVSPHELRGKLVLKIYLQQGGRDLYTGERVPLHEMELDHIVPKGKGGASVEDPKNWAMVKTGINRGKAQKDLDKYVNSTLENLFPKSKTEEEALETIRKDWEENEKRNIVNRKNKAEREGIDWSQADEDVFLGQLEALKKAGKAYYLVNAISGKKAITTIQLVATENQKGTETQYREYWLKVLGYTPRGDKGIPEGENTASWTLRQWLNNPDKRQLIESFWINTPQEAQRVVRRALEDSGTLSKEESQGIAMEFIKEETRKLISQLT
jgi:hypothetical protein